MAGLKNRVVIVTGAGNGIGRAHAHYLARAGARVVVNDIGGDVRGVGTDVGAAQQVVDEIVAAGGSAVPSTDTVAEPEGAKAIAETAVSAFGRIDAVVNNAGILRDEPFDELTTASLDAVMRTHLYASFFVTAAAWPHLRETDHGRVVVTTSTAGVFGNAGQTAYAAAKLGVIGLVRTLALEGAEFGIRCNAISPGGSTRMWTASGLEHLSHMNPMWASPAVAHFCSEECEESGLIVRAAGGNYRRVEFAISSPVSFENIPELDDFQDAWPQITNLDETDFAGKVGMV